MPKYQLKIKKTVEKELAPLPVPDILSIREHILDLSENPFPLPVRLQKNLKGLKIFIQVRPTNKLGASATIPRC